MGNIYLPNYEDIGLYFIFFPNLNLYNISESQPPENVLNYNKKKSFFSLQCFKYEFGHIYSRIQDIERRKFYKQKHVYTKNHA